MTPREWLRHWRALFEITRSMRRRAAHRPAGPLPPLTRLLVLPPDPVTLVGARGDQAMLQGAVDELRMDIPDLDVIVATASDEADAAAHAMGYESLRVPPIAAPFEWLVEQVDSLGINGVALLGADMLDGHYSAVFSARALQMIDTLARHGLRASVLGFSFNDKPMPVLKGVFNALSGATHLHTRDPVSQARLHAFTRARSTLVADAAFMLRPERGTPGLREVEAWVERQREAGHLVLGYNIHRGLVSSLKAGAATDLVSRSITALAGSATQHDIRWLLLPHDYREQCHDDHCLQPLSDGLRARGVQHHYAREPLSAGELKAVTGMLDGVVSGRMHLAIAALGEGVPVACITYQGKFEGLLAHFQMPPGLLLSPQMALEPGALEAFVERLVELLPEARERVRRALPAVMEASRLNLRYLRGDPAADAERTVDPSTLFGASSPFDTAAPSLPADVRESVLRRAES